MTKKSRPKRSRIWLMPDEEFLLHAKESISITEMCVRVGVKGGAQGTGYWAVTARAKELGVYENLSRGRKRQQFLKPLTELKMRSTLIMRIRRDNLLPYVCDECGNQGLWMGRPLTLQLHHINGVANDHRIENVTFLCPNCHSQTETWTGRNAKKGRKGDSREADPAPEPLFQQRKIRA